MLFIGDDWSEAHYDVELVDASGAVLERRKLPEGVAGVASLHELVAAHLGPDTELDQVLVGIETDRGPWGQALLATRLGAPRGAPSTSPSDSTGRQRFGASQNAVVTDDVVDCVTDSVNHESTLVGHRVGRAP